MPPRRGYQTQFFHVAECAESPAPGRDQVKSSPRMSIWNADSVSARMPRAGSVKGMGMNRPNCVGVRKN